MRPTLTWALAALLLAGPCPAVGNKKAKAADPPAEELSWREIREAKISEVAGKILSHVHKTRGYKKFITDRYFEDSDELAELTAIDDCAADLPVTARGSVAQAYACVDGGCSSGEDCLRVGFLVVSQDAFLSSEEGDPDPEGQLAWVLAHEWAHFLLRHAQKELALRDEAFWAWFEKNRRELYKRDGVAADLRALDGEAKRRSYVDAYVEGVFERDFVPYHWPEARDKLSDAWKSFEGDADALGRKLIDEMGYHPDSASTAAARLGTSLFLHSGRENTANHAALSDRSWELFRRDFDLP